VNPGETLGIVGESGSGKSVTTQAILGIIEVPGRIVGGDVRWKGKSVVQGPEAKSYAASVRGNDIGIVFQDPMTSLNPVFTVGFQISEVLRHHLGMNRKDAVERTLELLDLVGIPSPRQRAKQRPHEFSGGMRQRALIAMALACEPELLIADEPTTALDVTIQAQIFELLAEVQQRLNLAVLLVTHDLGVVADFCERVHVMYGGQVLERAPVDDLFSRPQSPYTGGLLRAMPRLDQVRDRLVAIEGSPPDLREPPPGCPFEPRCVFADDKCLEAPGATESGPDRDVACWHPLDEHGIDGAPETIKEASRG
jgi:peptide/nickel transport system ATP-binding protein